MTTAAVDPARVEALGPAERLISALLGASEHLVHHRPGIVAPDARHRTGVRWTSASCTVADGVATVRGPRAKGQTEGPILGTRREDGAVVAPAGTVLGSWQPAGLFPPAAVWMYQQVLDVYRLDPEFVARWASWAFGQEHRDLKVVLAAFLLAQPRAGRPLMNALGKSVRGPDGKPLVVEEDDREVGAAMCLLRRTDHRDLNPKLVLRVGKLLALPEIAALNRAAGFGGGSRHPHLGRWPAVVHAWLRARERNPALMASLVKAGFRTTAIRLAQATRYKPESPAFFAALRWKQAQHAGGHRTVAIGDAVAAAESWAGLDERAVCLRITAEKPAWKRLVSLVPPDVGLTPAIVAAAVEAGSLAGTDLVIATPTLEELGLLSIDAVRKPWEAATRAAESQRARNIAKNVQAQETKAKLVDAADAQAAREARAATRGLRLQVIVDISGSMQDALPTARALLVRLIAGVPTDKVRIAVFNTVGRELSMPKVLGDAGAPLAPHVATPVLEALFRGIAAGGGTDYASGVVALRGGAQAGPDEDTVVLFVGDEGQGYGGDRLAEALRAIPNLAGIGLVKVPGEIGNVVHEAAAKLRLPLAELQPSDLPEDDPYRVSGVLRALLAAAPVRVATPAAAPRVSLVQQILATERLRVPAWAAA